MHFNMSLYIFFIKCTYSTFLTKILNYVISASNIVVADSSVAANGITI